MKLDMWASRWGIPKEALDDLRKIFGFTQLVGIDCKDQVSEAAVMNLVRLEASKKNCRLWRNNVGALHTSDGNFVRFGLANESSNMNGSIKSGDLIGIRPIKISSMMVGMTIGQFISREIKQSNWKYTGIQREEAQLRWIELINSLGGDACFSNKEGSL